MTARFTYHPDNLDALRRGGIDAIAVAEYLDDPEFGFSYDDGGYPADIILQSAFDTGVLAAPDDVHLSFVFLSNEGEVAYEYHLYVPIPGGGSLKLSSYAYDYPEGFADDDARGRSAIDQFLRDVVNEANTILDNLDKYKNA